MNSISRHTALHIVRSLLSLDQRKAVSLVLLNLSAALDTIYHKMLLGRLSHICVQGMAHKWFQSYLQNRHQSVIIKGAKSKSVPLRYGVPQGSVLGPFFTQYTVPDLCDIQG